MPAQQILSLTKVCHRLEATDADLSNSVFSDVNLTSATFENVNLSAVVMNNACLTNLHITDANTSGMTIEGILVSDLQAAYRANRP